MSTDYVAVVVLGVKFENVSLAEKWYVSQEDINEQDLELIEKIGLDDFLNDYTDYYATTLNALNGCGFVIGVNMSDYIYSPATYNKFYLAHRRELIKFFKDKTIEIHNCVVVS